jgi:hypothetical protein
MAPAAAAGGGAGLRERTPGRSGGGAASDDLENLSGGVSSGRPPAAPRARARRAAAPARRARREGGGCRRRRHLVWPGPVWAGRGAGEGGGNLEAEGGKAEQRNGRAGGRRREGESWKVFRESRVAGRVSWCAGGVGVWWVLFDLWLVLVLVLPGCHAGWSREGEVCCCFLRKASSPGVGRRGLRALGARRRLGRCVGSRVGHFLGGACAGSRAAFASGKVCRRAQVCGPGGSRPGRAGTRALWRGRAGASERLTRAGRRRGAAAFPAGGPRCHDGPNPAATHRGAGRRPRPLPARAARKRPAADAAPRRSARAQRAGSPGPSVTGGPRSHGWEGPLPIGFGRQAPAAQARGAQVVLPAGSAAAAAARARRGGRAGAQRRRGLCRRKLLSEASPCEAGVQGGWGPGRFHDHRGGWSQRASVCGRGRGGRQKR